MVAVPGTACNSPRGCNRRRTDCLVLPTNRFLVLRSLGLRHGINAEFLADMSEFLRIGEAAVAHHRAECREARLGEDQPRQALAGVEPHQSTVQKPLGDGGDLRLAGVRAAAPGLELEALRHARQRREEDIRFAADIGSLARREPGDPCSVRLGHGLDTRTSGRPGPKPSTTRDVAVGPLITTLAGAVDTACEQSREIVPPE